jgi:hypothetical protein
MVATIPTPVSIRRPIHHCPDSIHVEHFCEALQPGDVILISMAGRRHIVYTFQRTLKHFSAISHLFVHVAIYVGGGKIVHAVPSSSYDGLQSAGVQGAAIGEILSEERLFVFLRANVVQKDHWEALSKSATSHVGVPYDYVGCVRAVLRASGVPGVSGRIRAGRPLPKSPGVESNSTRSGRALVCSDFVCNVFDEVFQDRNPCNISGGRLHGIATPCEFFSNPNFKVIGV